MRPNLSSAMKVSLVEVGTVISISFQNTVAKPGLFLPGRVVAKVVTRQGFTYEGCPLLSPGGCSLPPDVACTPIEAAAELAKMTGVFDLNKEVVLIFMSDDTGRGAAPFVLADMPTSQSVFPVANPLPDVAVPPLPELDYLARWTRDLIMRRDYGILSSEMVISALAGALFNLTGTDFRVQLSPLNVVRVSKLGVAPDRLLLASTTIAYLDVLAARAAAAQVAQIAQQAALTALAVSAAAAALDNGDPALIALAATATSAVTAANALVTASASVPVVPASTVPAIKSATFHVPLDPTLAV